MIQREWQRVDPRCLDEEEQRFWARIAGRQARFDDRVTLFEKLTARASKAALEQFLFTCAAENPNRRLRTMALSDRVGMTIDRASFDDLVTLVTQAPPWEKDRVQGVRILLRAVGEERPDAPEQILARWTWRLARAVRKVLDRKASAEYPEAKRLLGALANSRGHRHEENAAKLVAAAGPCRWRLPPRSSPPPRATRHARITCSTRRASSWERASEVASALADDLPAPKAHPSRRRRERRKRKPAGAEQAPEQSRPEQPDREQTQPEQTSAEPTPIEATAAEPTET